MEKSAKKLVPSFRAPEDLKNELDAAIEKSGLNKTDFMIELVSNALENEEQEKGDVKTVNPETIQNTVSGDIVKILKNMSDSLEKLSLSKEELLSEEAISELREEIESELKEKHLVLDLTPEQKKVFTDLLMYRNSKGHKNSSSAEELFAFMLEETFSGFNKKHPEFINEFEEAYSDYILKV